jgi:hypothetical protein
MTAISIIFKNVYVRPFEKTVFGGRFSSHIEILTCKYINRQGGISTEKKSSLS